MEDDLITMYRAVEVKPKEITSGKNEIQLLDQSYYPKFHTREEASDWIHKPENFQKEWMILEVEINKKYVS